MDIYDFKRYTQDHMKTWAEYSCTLLCNGWKGPTKHHVLNFMVCYEMGAIFLKTNISSHGKGAQFLLFSNQ